MKVRMVSCILVVLLLIMNVLPVISGQIEAAGSMTINIVTIEAHDILVEGEVNYSVGSFSLIELSLFDRSGRFIKKVEISHNPFSYQMRELNDGVSYQIQAKYYLKLPQQTGFSNKISFSTKKEPVLSPGNFLAGINSVQFNLGVEPNGQVLKRVGYRLSLSEGYGLNEERIIMTNVSAGGTKNVNIEGLSVNTSYRMSLFTETQLGWEKIFGPYDFNTADFNITTYPVPTVMPSSSPTPSPLPSPTPSPLPSPTPSASPAPSPTAITPAPTPQATSAADATTGLTPTPSVPPAETTLPGETTGTGGFPTQETTSDNINPQGRREGEFPRAMLIVALIAVAGLGFGAGGAIMVFRRRKK